MSSEQSSSGIGLLGVLFIVFLVLKLTGTITWSWWWITAPLWGSLALTIVGIIIWLFALLVIGIIAAVISRKW